MVLGYFPKYGNCESRIGKSNRKRIKTEPITCLPFVGRRIIGSTS